MKADDHLSSGLVNLRESLYTQKDLRSGEGVYFLITAALKCGLGNNTEGASAGLAKTPMPKGPFNRKI